MGGGVAVEEEVWARGWFLIDAGKMRKSKGNVVEPRPIANVLGMDALRYYMLRETVFGQDGNFSYDALVQRYNSDLANGLGNLASRTLTMVEKYCGGALPKGSGELAISPAPWRVPERIQQIRALYQQYQFTRALE